MGVDLPDFREGQVKSRNKTGKCSILQALKMNFYHLSLNGKNTILTPNTLSDFKIEPENSKTFSQF